MDNCRCYMHREMDRSEMDAFESRFAREEIFAREVRQNLNLLLALGREQIREKVAIAVEEQVSQERARRRRQFRLTGIAASLIFLIGIGLVFLLPSEPNLDEIYAEHFTSYSLGSRTLIPNHDSLWNQALDLYESDQEEGWSMAAERFIELLKNPSFSRPHSNEANLYLGITYLKLGNPGEALIALSRVDEKATGYAEKAVWYRGMAHILNGDKAAAIQLFSAFRNDPRWSKTWRERAADICEDLGCE